MRARVIAVLISVMFVLGAVTISAHHSWNTVFSEDKPLVLRGLIVTAYAQVDRGTNAIGVHCSASDEQETIP